MNLEQVRQLKIVHTLENALAPNPVDCLRDAEREDAKPIYVCASDYSLAIHVLRSKGFTWRECQEWLEARSAKFSESAIISGYRKIYRQEDGSLPDLSGDERSRILMSDWNVNPS